MHPYLRAGRELAGRALALLLGSAVPSFIDGALVQARMLWWGACGWHLLFAFLRVAVPGCCPRSSGCVAAVALRTSCRGAPLPHLASVLMGNGAGREWAKVPCCGVVCVVWRACTHNVMPSRNGTETGTHLCRDVHSFPPIRYR